jgi:tetratricopeptide (TPR) repeat protein
MISPLVAPERSAHASLEGYLYQTWLGVERWLELGEGEALRCEGDEDLDRLFLDGSGGTSEQVKALTGGVNVRDEVVKATLRRFLVAHRALRERGDGRRFVFTTTAERRQQALGDLKVDVLTAWQEARTRPEVRSAVVAALRRLLPFPEPDASRRPRSHGFWLELQAALGWLDGEPERWADLIASIEWRLGAPERGQVQAAVEAALAARRPNLPQGFALRLLGELLEASADPDPARRVRPRADLERLLGGAEAELARWAAGSRGRRLAAVVGELDALQRVLYTKAQPLAARPLPSQLLSAAFEVIPFAEEGRREVLEELAAWCAGEERFGVRLFYGDGGLGKTRLLLEWCRRLTAQGWAAGFLFPTSERQDLATLLEGAVPRLVVVDYAETRYDDVRYLVERMARLRDGPKLRVVLLARREVGWTVLARSAEEEVLLARKAPQELPLLAAGMDELRGAFRAAAGVFAGRLRLQAPAAPPEPDLTDPAFGRPLYLHMAALAAAHGRKVASVEEALAETLRRERSYWRREVEIASPDEEKRRELEKAIERGMTVLTLLGGAATPEAARTCAGRVLPDGAGEARVGLLVDLLRGLYAAAARSGRYLAALEPDVLGEQLAAETLSGAAELLDLAVEVGDAEGRGQIVTVLGRLAQRRPEPGGRILAAAFSRHLDALAEAALQVAARLGDPVGQLLAREVEARASPKLARRLMGRCDEPALQGTVPLREVALAATRWVYDELRQAAPRRSRFGRWWRGILRAKQSSEALSELARLANNLGGRLSELGQREPALAATQEAVAIRRRLVEERPDAFLPELAGSLNNLGNGLSELGQREPALEATQEAVELYRRLAEKRPDAFLPDLASSLNNLGIRLSELGQREPALEATQEAVELYRRLAEKRPDAFLPDLASSLNNLGAMLSELGQREPALEATQEAVELYRRLAEKRPDAFLPDLAMSLNNLGAMLSELGQREPALEGTQEAVELYRRLAEKRPDAFLPDLAMSLNNLGNRLSELGQREPALEATQEAVELYRRLAEKRPDAFLPDLASSLNNLGNRLSELGRYEEALAASAEAIRLLAPFFVKRPDAFRSWMAKMIGSYRACCRKAGRQPDSELLKPVLSLLEPEG